MLLRKKIYILIFIPLLLLSCGVEKQRMESLWQPATKVQPIDTLHVAMRNAPLDFFLFLGEKMGYNYELANHLAAFLDVPMQLHIANNESEMLEMLQQGKVHLVASTVYERNILKKLFEFVAFQDHSHLVLVQLIGLNTITEPVEMIGKTVYAIKNTQAHNRLVHLNRELGGGIQIQTLPDTTTTDQLITKVLNSHIEFAIADHKTAAPYRRQNRRLDVRVRLGFTQRNGWLVNNKDTALIHKINLWDKDSTTLQWRSQMYSKYRIRNPFFSAQRIQIPKGNISPYDHLFKKYAQEINWEWQWLASIAFHESRFDSTQISHRGASGLMQLMPRTAASFGLNSQNILNPARNIEASVQYIKSLNLLFRRIVDVNERRKFILAAYNAGPAHIFDAMALAEKHGKNPHVWFDHVAYYLEKKNDPVYYNDEVVRFGAFRANQTLSYVREVISTFQRFTGAY